jgi:hypothetical protein
MEAAGDHEEGRATTLPNPDNTVLSLGAGGFRERIREVGIRGRTDSHIHWEVVRATATPASLGEKHGSDEEHVRCGATLVSLGEPTQDTEIKSWATRKPGDRLGYTVLTENVAWQESRHLFYLTSERGDVIAHAKQRSVVLQADKQKVIACGGGGVDIHGKGKITIGSSVQVDSEKPNYVAQAEAAVGTLMANKLAQYFMKASDVIASVLSVMKSYRDKQTEAKPGETGWQKMEAADKLKMVTEVAKIFSQVARTSSGIASESQSGTVGLVADTYATIGAGTAVSLYGGASASMTSLLSASLLGGTASVKGLAWASVWAGHGVSINGRQRASLESEKGRVKVKGYEKVEVSSESKEVKVTGNTLAQLNANDGPVWVHGTTAVKIGAGTDSGHAIHVLPEKVVLAKATSGAGSADKVKLDDDQRIELDDKGVALRHGGAKVDVRGGSVELSVKSGRARIAADRILLG